MREIERRTFIKDAAAVGRRRCFRRARLRSRRRPAGRPSRSTSSCRWRPAAPSISSRAQSARCCQRNARPADRRRKSHRRRRHHRHGCSAEERARRLHRADHQRQRGERAAYHEARPTTTPRSCCRSAISAISRRSSRCIRRSASIRSKEFVDYVKKNPGPRLRLVGRRLEPARGRRVVRQGSRHQARARALSRRRPGGQRSDRGACEIGVPRADLDVPALQGRHYQIAGAHRPKRAPTLTEVPTLGGVRLQGGARRLVRGFRAARHAAGMVDELNAEMNNVAQGCEAARKLQGRRGRADRRHAGRNRQIGTGRFGEIRAAGERAQHQDELAAFALVLNLGMDMKRREFFGVLGGAAATLQTAAHPAFAQSKYPERPIRLVIPFPPGGAYDAIGRGWADRMKASARYSRR